jgi:ComF family protein
VCGGPLLFEGKPLQNGLNNAVCPTCIATIKPQRGALCACCGEALGMESERYTEQRAAIAFESPRCSPCRLAPPAFERAVAFGVYQGDLREMIHLLKFEGIRSLARTLGKMLAQAIATLQPATPTGLHVIPVPLFHAKGRTRGYNQSEILAAEAIRAIRTTRPGWPLQLTPRLLHRIRDTESQFNLTPRMRRLNLRGAFAVPDPTPIAGRDVLLIDDIYTTGATARECSKVLQAAGARRVYVATLARAQVETVALWDAHKSSATPSHYTAGGTL